MGSKKVKRRLLLAARPSLRKHPRPPKARTLMGESFSIANFASPLVMQHCQDCGTVNYPSRERCSTCLSDSFRWRQTDTSGEIVSCTQINVSQWEFFKRKVKDAPWPIASVKLADQILFTHLAIDTFSQLTDRRQIEDMEGKHSMNKENPYLLAPGTKVKVFSQSDTGTKSVLITVSEDTDISQANQRKAIAVDMGIAE